MALKTVFDNVLRKTGRFELGTISGVGDPTDNGLIALINDAQRELDSMVDTPKSRARYSFDMAAGTVVLDFQYCRVIQEVWLVNSVDETWELEKKPEDWIRRQYGTDPALITQALPEVYCISSDVYGPEQDTLTDVGGANPYTGDHTYDHDFVKFGDHYSHKRIIIMPPPSATVTCTVYGEFEQQPLAAWADENYWTEKKHDILEMMTILQLEDEFGNTQGQNDRLGTVLRKLKGVHADWTKEQWAGVTHARG